MPPAVFRSAARLFLPLRVCAAVLLAGAGIAASASGATDFQQVVEPFLKQHCAKCHSAEAEKAGKLKGKVRVDNLPATGAPERWKAVAEQLALGEMPPEKEPRPSAHGVERIVALIKAGLAREGVEFDDVEAKRQMPQHGNRVDHATLFSGEVKTPAASPPRLWRMSPFLYSGFIRKVTGAKGNDKSSRVAQAFSTSSAPGFKDYAELFSIDEPTVGQLMRNAQQIVEMQTGAKAAKEFRRLLEEGNPPTAQDIEAAIRRQFQAALLREPSGEEVARFTAYAQKTMRDAGQTAGAKAMLATVLLLPEALYRSERGEGRADAGGRRMLTPREIAYAVAFALTDAPPDGALLEAAVKGRLATREDAAREVRRILDDPKAGRARVMRFFEEYFEYPAALDVFKDLPRGKWTPEVLVSDTQRLIAHVLDQDRDVFRELLTTRKSFVNYAEDAQKKTPKPARIANKPREEKDEAKRDKTPKPRQLEIWDLYNLPEDWQWTAEQPVELPGDQRAGILTQPSWLAAFASNDANDAIRRGKWVRERLLGGAIPDLPITVDAQLPDAPERTLRERMEKTRDEYCWRCHEKMNPLGLTFEMYDYLGRARTAELVHDRAATAANLDKKGKPLGPVLRDAPLDATGAITASGDPRLDGASRNAVEMLHRIAASDRARQVFVRHAFRYWMGRNELLSDSPTLIAADRAYVQSGGSMKALVASLLTSDSFLYRYVTQPTGGGLP